MALPQMYAGKTALLTGSSKGIDGSARMGTDAGAAAALQYAAQGANVVINYSSDESAAQQLAQRINAPDRVLVLKGDAGDVATADYLVNETVKRFGKIDILVPCAAVFDLKPPAAVTEADFDRHMRVNVKGPFFLVQKAVPHMPEGSRIVLISSSLTANSSVLPIYLTYNATKGAIEQMTRCLAKDLASKHINVNCLNPGPTATELFLKGKPQEMIDHIASTIPYKRLGEPDEVAEVMLFLTSPAARWVTGQILRANGGMVV